MADLSVENPGEREWANLALAQAAHRDDVEAIEKLLALGADPNSTMAVDFGSPCWPFAGGGGLMTLRTPLMCACLAGSARAAAALASKTKVFEQAPDWRVYGERQLSALDCAALSRSMECAQAVLGEMSLRAREDKWDRDKKEQAAWRAAEVAARAGWFDGCKRLAEVAAAAGGERLGRPALPVKANPARALVEALADGARKRGWNAGEAQAQEIAAGIEILTICAKARSFGDVDHNGVSALGLAASGGLPEICRWMLGFEAGLGESAGGGAVIELVRRKRRSWEPPQQKSQEVLGALLAGCDALGSDKDGATALMRACEANASWALDALIEKSDPLERDPFTERSAIEWAPRGSEALMKMKLFFTRRKKEAEREELRGATVGGAGAGNAPRRGPRAL